MTGLTSQGGQERTGQQVHDPVTDCLSSFLQDQLGSPVTWAPTPARLPGTSLQRGGRDQRGGGGERGKELEEGWGLREEGPRPRKKIEGKGLKSRQVLREKGGGQGEEESGDCRLPLLADTPAASSQLPLIRAPVITRTWVAATAQRPCRCPGIPSTGTATCASIDPPPPAPQFLKPDDLGARPSSADRLCDPGRVAPHLWGWRAEWHSSTGQATRVGQGLAGDGPLRPPSASAGQRGGGSRRGPKVQSLPQLFQ